MTTTTGAGIVESASAGFPAAAFPAVSEQRIMTPVWYRALLNMYIAASPASYQTVVSEIASLKARTSVLESDVSVLNAEVTLLNVEVAGLEAEFAQTALIAMTYGDEL